MGYPYPLDPESVFTSLAGRNVRYILVGAMAGRLHGMPRLTADVDLWPDTTPPNLSRLAAALRDLGARVHTEGIPEGLVFDCSAESISRASIWNLTTLAGRIDLLFEPAGAGEFGRALERIEEMSAFGVTIPVASLEDLISMKRAADRPQDRQDVIVLEHIRSRW